MYRSKKILFAAIASLMLIGIGVGIFFLKTGPRIDRVVLITVDTLRADHIGAYGYPRDTSPFFDEISGKGVLFQNCFAPMSTTVPSLASMFTSLYPLQHGVIKNGLLLEDRYMTLAEVFKKKRYKTAGIVSTRQFEAANMKQGFDYFDEPVADEKLSKTKYRPAGSTVSRALEWLENLNSDDRAFIWIHLFDPHIPLQAPEQISLRLKSETNDDRMINYLLKTHRTELDYFRNNEAYMLGCITAYDAEVRYADDQIRRFFDYYQSTGLGEKTLWIYTADHGEGLGNHNFWGHGKHIYNEQLHIPLLMYCPDWESPVKLVEELVESIDLFPTLCDLIDASASLPDNIQGCSLIPVLFPGSGRITPRPIAFSQRRDFDPVERPELGDEKFAVQSSQYKYIHATEGPDEFFNLQRDPYETMNLINSKTDEETCLKNMLFNKVRALKSDSAATHIYVDENAIEHLRSLGYTN